MKLKELCEKSNGINSDAFTKKEKVSNKPEMGHVKKANTTPKRFLKEIKGLDIYNEELNKYYEIYGSSNPIFNSKQHSAYFLIENMLKP